jgi:hypothetical protein
MFIFEVSGNVLRYKRAKNNEEGNLRYGLYDCPPKIHVLKGWPPGCLLGPLGGRASWWILRSLGTYPWRGLWDPLLFLFAPWVMVWAVCSITCSHLDMLSWLEARSNEATWTWTRTSWNGNQNKSSLFKVNCLMYSFMVMKSCLTQLLFPFCWDGALWLFFYRMWVFIKVKRK